MARSPSPSPATNASPRTSPGRPVSESSWSGTLCGSVTFRASSRTRLRAISNVRAPVPPAGLARKICHDSPHQAVRLFVSRLPKRPGSFTTAPEPSIWSAAQVSGLPTLRTSAASPSAATTATVPTRPRTTSRRRPATRRSTGTRATSARTTAAPITIPHAEQGAVGDTIRTRAAVLDEGRARERPPGHEDRGAGRKQRLERRLDPPLAEPERESDNREPGEEAGAGLGQEDHERGRIEEQRPRGAAEAVAHRGDEPEAEAERSAREERERVPVADRSLQSRDAPRIVRAERRDRLAEERPDEDGAEQGGEEQRERAHGPPPGQAGGREADDAEGEEDDSLGERIPGAVARDRPPHGQPGPRDERDHGRSGSGARAIEAGEGHDGRATTRRPAAAATITAAVPSDAVAPVPDAPPAKSAQPEKDGGGREHGTGET